MERKTLIPIFMVVLLMISGQQIFAQRGYTEFENKENMQIMYRWQRTTPFDDNSDAVLNIRVTNNNGFPVNWTYSIGFYKNGVLDFESEPGTLCLNPGQSRRGATAGLRFTAQGVKMEDVESDDFSWEFGIFDVEQVEKCN